MRLSQAEILVIKNVIRKFSPIYELYLHGSRLSDELKGGDIDLFIVLPDDVYKDLQTKKHYLESELSINLNEQKIDITLISQSNISSNDFFRKSEKMRC